MPEDKFQKLSEGLSTPLTGLEDVTPSDTADLLNVSRAINVATGGSLRVTTLNGETGTITVIAGTPFPIRVTRVWATGTTASGIVGLF